MCLNKEGKSVKDKWEGTVHVPGTGSDFVAFIHHAGIAMNHMEFKSLVRNSCERLILCRIIRMKQCIIQIMIVFIGFLTLEILIFHIMLVFFCVNKKD